MNTPKLHAGNWKDLERNLSDDAVAKMVDHMNMSGGSTGVDLDLYVLVYHYIKNEKVRAEINKVLADHRCL